MGVSASGVRSGFGRGGGPQAGQPGAPGDQARDVAAAEAGVDVHHDDV
jgi:hypothetical protein